MKTYVKSGEYYALVEPDKPVQWTKSKAKATRMSITQASRLASASRNTQVVMENDDDME